MDLPDLRLSWEPDALVEEAEWVRLRAAHSAALVEYSLASAVIIDRLVSNAEPTPEELQREDRAIEALAAAREAFFSAWHRVS
jgi:hypothetical protein